MHGNLDWGFLSMLNNTIRNSLKHVCRCKLDRAHEIFVLRWRRPETSQGIEMDGFLAFRPDRATNEKKTNNPGARVIVCNHRIAYPCIIRLQLPSQTMVSI